MSKQGARTLNQLPRLGTIVQVGPGTASHTTLQRSKTLNGYILKHTRD